MNDRCPTCNQTMKWIKKRSRKNMVECPLCKCKYIISEVRLT